MGDNEECRNVLTRAAETSEPAAVHGLCYTSVYVLASTVGNSMGLGAHLLCRFEDGRVVPFSAHKRRVGFHEDPVFEAIFYDLFLLVERVELLAS